MIRTSLQEVSDRAVYLLSSLGVSSKEIVRCCGISELGIRQAIKRVIAGRYGSWVPHVLKPGEARDVNMASFKTELTDESKELLRQFHEDVERIIVKEFPMHINVPSEETQKKTLRALLETLESRKEGP